MKVICRRKDKEPEERAQIYLPGEYLTPLPSFPLRTPAPHANGFRMEQVNILQNHLVRFYSCLPLFKFGWKSWVLQWKKLRNIVLKSCRMEMWILKINWILGTPVLDLYRDLVYCAISHHYILISTLNSFYKNIEKAMVKLISYFQYDDPNELWGVSCLRSSVLLSYYMYFCVFFSQGEKN